MNISFEGKVALATGAASGLGLATAKAFADAGASVALADWNEDAARLAADQLAAQGHRAMAIGCDVADDAQVEAMVEATVRSFGRLDIAYNNAGVQNVLAETADTTREDYDRVMGINLRGIWSCMKFELRHMREQGSGVGRQLLFTWRAAWRCRARHLSRGKARSTRLHKERGSRIRQARDSHQRDLPRSDLDANGRPDGRRWPGRSPKWNGQRRSDGKVWPCR